MKKIEKVFFKYIINPTVETSPEATSVKRPANNTGKIFSSAELWNIQRKRRATVVR